MEDEMDRSCKTYGGRVRAHMVSEGKPEWKIQQEGDIGAGITGSFRLDLSGSRCGTAEGSSESGSGNSIYIKVLDCS
jgi:hypothetical protein